MGPADTVARPLWLDQIPLPTSILVEEDVLDIMNLPLSRLMALYVHAHKAFHIIQIVFNLPCAAARHRVLNKDTTQALEASRLHDADARWVTA